MLSVNLFCRLLDKAENFTSCLHQSENYQDVKALQNQTAFAAYEINSMNHLIIIIYFCI